MDSIDEAQRSGFASALIEAGLWYIVFRADSEADLSKISGDPQELLIFWLNDYKNNKEWISYIPFVSSIKGSKNLLSFIEDSLSIAVIVGISSLREVASINGLHFEIKEDNHELPFWFYPVVDGDFSYEEGFAMSTHYIHRVPLEFRSLNMLLTDSKKIFVE
jgi:hypothetical protein